jgi:hypothetical protein
MKQYHCQSMRCQSKKGEPCLLTEHTVRWITYRHYSLPVCQQAFDDWHAIPMVGTASANQDPTQQRNRKGQKARQKTA